MTETRTRYIARYSVPWTIAPPPPRVVQWRPCTVHGWREHTADGECWACIADELRLDREYRCALCHREECSH